MDDTKTLNELNTSKTDNWNYGIDILRMLSMFMICILHTLNQGGVLSHCDQDGVINWSQYYTGWVLEIATFCCVDIYALISGYVGYKSKFKISKILYIWLEVVFYCAFITLYFKIKYPDLVTSLTWKKAFLPVMYNQYWYMTAYIPLMIVSPFLNIGIQKLDNKFLSTFALFLLIIICYLPIHLDVSVFGLGSGYSFIWLLLCYLLGGAIAKSNITKHVPFYVGLIVYVLMVGLTYYLFRKGKNDYVNYNSPTILIEAIGLLFACSKIRIKTRPAKYTLKLFGEASLAVYLIHVHPLIWSKYIKLYSQKFNMTANPSVMHLLWMIFLGAFTIYFASSIIDIVRIYLWRLLHVKNLLGLIDKLYDKIPVKNNNDQA